MAVDWIPDMLFRSRWCVVLGFAVALCTACGGAPSAGDSADLPHVPCDPRGPIPVVVTDDVRRVCERLDDGARVEGCVVDFEAIARWVNEIPTFGAGTCTDGAQKPPALIRECLGFPASSTLRDLTIASADLGVVAGKSTEIKVDLYIPSLGARVVFEGRMKAESCTSGSSWVAKMWWHQ